MKIVHFCTYDFGGGAAIAAYDLHKSFRFLGMSSRLIVRFKKSRNDSVIGLGGRIRDSRLSQDLLRNPFNYWLFRKFIKYWNLINKNNQSFVTFNPNRSPISFQSINNHVKGAHVVFLHWIDHFLTSEMISEIHHQTGAKIVWIMQDLEPITGGCHYPGDCKGFEETCGWCPQLGSKKENDLSRRNWNIKNKYLKGIDIHFVAPSSWVFSKIKRSSLFKYHPIEKIFLPVDEGIFRKYDQNKARKKLYLPEEKKIIFFGSHKFRDHRKGLKYMIESLTLLKEKLRKERRDDSVLLLTAGRDVPRLKHIFHHRHFGWINNLSMLALLYQAADVFASPSIEDAGPIMVNQSLLCGTPVVAFDMGVSRDLIEPGTNGFYVENMNSQAFCEALYDILFRINKAAQPTWANEHTKDKILARYLEFLANLVRN